VRVLHFAASNRQHCFLCEFFWDALSNKVCVDTTVDGAAVLFVRGATRFFFSFALLFGQTGGFCLFLAAALSGASSFSRRARSSASCFSRAARCSASMRWRSASSARLSLQLHGALRLQSPLCASLRHRGGLVLPLPLNALFVLTLSLFRQAALLFAVTVKSLFISRAISWSASNWRPLLIELLFITSASACIAFMASSALMRSCSASHSVSGRRRIAQLVAGINETLNFGLSRAHSFFQALQVLTARLFDCRLAAGHLRRQRGDTVTAFLRGQVRHFVYCLADLLDKHQGRPLRKALAPVPA
jgi:hypothetical protein